MTLAQLEERVMELEKAVAELRRAQPPLDKVAAGDREDKIIPGTEYPVFLSKPPAETIRCEAVIKWVNLSPTQELGLSHADARYFMRVGLPHDARAFEKEGDVKP